MVTAHRPLPVKKAPGSGDGKTTKITIPSGKPADITNENNDTLVGITDGDPNVEINITETGSLDIVMDESNGSHEITIAGPGADINISDEGNMTITTPQTINTDGSTCEYILDIVYDGTDMITRHILNAGSADEVVTTVIMKIPDSDIDVTEDNIVTHFGSFINGNLDDVNVTASVKCDGSISTITKIENIEGSFVAVNEPGSTVIIDINGDVDTTNRYDAVDGSDNEIVIELNLKVDSDSGDINGTKVHKDKSTDEVIYTQAINKIGGSKLVITDTKIKESTAKFENDNEVQVIVTDENNDTVTSLTTISPELNITKVSNGETGAVTREISSELSDAIIVIDNFLDGKVKHRVELNGTITEARSNLEGADINVSSEGVTTIFEDTAADIKIDSKSIKRW